MIYTFFCFIVLCVVAPFLALLCLRSKFKRSIPARFFLKNNPKFKSSKYHFHACSLGEVSSIEPIVKALGDARISVITQTGFNKATSVTKNVRFLPFECFLPFWFSKCDTLIVFEAELWLNLFKFAKISGARTILLNARISDKSYKSYLRFGFYYRYLFSYVDLVLAQSDDDKTRLESLGAKNVKVVGNIKSTKLPKPTKNYAKHFERSIIIASSHENEEKRILQNLNLKDGDQLFIAPRHPERFGKVDVLAKDFASKFGFGYEKFSQNLEFKSKIVLVDTLGELVNLYKICDIVILCGSFEPGIGGHNVIEAAQFGCKIISGKFIDNQKSLYASIDGINLADYSDIPMLLDSNLKSSSIRNPANFDEILKELKGEK
ncbi:3-deoxy-D-manno-octulosonic-acid transferase [Campylobacter hyointestinalis]|uniref:lipid IV(A) 3-deoxy-D-manno-octulosonic acid transferase n=1 Tax=Campylobacter hyointestinalis TaxID=198 RepID=UPI000691C89A|nr:lipid IV(A) 3-deoxy-D-manno-octulosonic acid transferase [Campylobacter hyointestinalis]ANE32767.1 3-deoxy-D-manno-octulosonic-acid transferase (KDO transferase) [Campylobacter hyointestinalis subsp. hyointestinalis LMG 9260]QKF55937.1 3-deoxy-D-manno-octulosonic-acid transferase (KDO transferase) [Campylobacter hyointestinalis subsp. hyointestinalis]TWO28459.1 3-deoxy-D-manno-octulosonic acid transferase [Campylobacter hyointestinalis]TXK48239.1 3-deoxy-D-manno-octulosonic acid transferase 